MRLLLVTDAWAPQVNGVVTTLVELVRELKKLGHQVTVVHPGLFKTRPCPGYAGIDLAIKPFGASYMVEENPKSYLGYSIAHTDRIFVLNNYQIFRYLPKN